MRVANYENICPNCVGHVVQLSVQDSWTCLDAYCLLTYLPSFGMPLFSGFNFILIFLTKIRCVLIQFQKSSCPLYKIFNSWTSQKRSTLKVMAMVKYSKYTDSAISNYVNRIFFFFFKYIRRVRWMLFCPTAHKPVKTSLSNKVKNKELTFDRIYTVPLYCAFGQGLLRLCSQ